MLTAAELPRQQVRCRRVQLPGSQVRVGGQQRLGKPLLIVLFALHEPPVHSAMADQLAELLRCEIPDQSLHPGHGLFLGPAVIFRDAAHDLALDDHRVPQGVHTVRRRIFRHEGPGFLETLTAGAVLGHSPVLRQIFVDPLNGFLVGSGRFQPLHIIGQSHIQTAKCFIQVLHKVRFLSVDCYAAGWTASPVWLCQNQTASSIQPSASVPLAMPMPCGALRYTLS